MAASIVSQMVLAGILGMLHVPGFGVEILPAIVLTAVLEVATSQIDNLVLPLFFFACGELTRSGLRRYHRF